MPNDFISRATVLSDIEQTIENSGCVNHEREIIDCVRYATSADVVQVVHARWGADADGDYYRCSACSEWQDRKTAYCPNCGAKMDGGEQHAD